MSNVLAFQQAIDFETIICYKCAVAFAVPKAFRAKRLQDHETFWCPNGHDQHYTGKSEAEQLRDKLATRERQLQWANETADRLRDQRTNLEHRLNGTKGALTKVKKRIAGGACPCCNRTFDDLRRHMATKHPKYQPDERGTK